MNAPALSKAQIVDQLRRLGVAGGGVLLVHTSFRAVRPVEGGPAGLIAALCDALGSGTLVMPSWTGHDEEPFDPSTTPASFGGSLACAAALTPSPSQLSGRWPNRSLPIRCRCPRIYLQARWAVCTNAMVRCC
jgi:hypothetical protein